MEINLFQYMLRKIWQVINLENLPLQEILEVILLKKIKEKERSMLKAFNDLDADGSGEITEDEILTFFKQTGISASLDDAKRMIDILDIDKNKKIEYNEFSRFLLLLPSTQLSAKQVIFDWVDSADWVMMFHYRMSMVPPWKTSLQLAAGGLAGVVSRTVVAPIERLRNIINPDPYG
eukprot:TRINITY_DN10233_c0_g1_i3.p1 TRINITY_DN10233_c0_g1~~TRINITY_DN10233_c0_g1_i3.p1  ORF type:complete len:177 (-),score=30.50 TRINITY_DN10233_c0_g1_i3:17-547(-)